LCNFYHCTIYCYKHEFFHVKRNVTQIALSVQFLFAYVMDFVRLPSLLYIFKIAFTVQDSVNVPSFFRHKDYDEIVVDVFAFHLSRGTFWQRSHEPWHGEHFVQWDSRYRVLLKETFLIVNLRPIIFQNDPRLHFVANSYSM
jgi:hypothetical protein